MKNSSRKFTLALVAMGLCLATGGLTLVIPGITAAIETMVGGIIGVYALYCGGNVGSKWAFGKQLAAGLSGGLPVSAGCSKGCECCKADSGCCECCSVCKEAG